MKKIISALLAISVIAHLNITSVLVHASDDSPIFAEELMEYTGNQPLLNNPCNGGTGFAGKWEPGVGGFDGYVPRTRPDKDTMWIAMYSRFTCDTLKREFLNPIKTNESADYIISVNFGWNILDNETKGRIFLSTKENSAEAYICAGFEYKDDGVYPYAMVGGNKVYGKNKVTSLYNRLKMHINISEDKNITLKIKNYGWDDAEPSSYDAEAKGKISVSELTHFKFDSEILTASSLRWGYLGSIIIEKYEGEEYENALLIADTLDRMKKGEEVSEEECNALIEKLSQGISIMGIDPTRDYKEIILPYLEETGLIDKMPGFYIESINLEEGSVVLTDEISEIIALTNLPVASGEVKVVSESGTVDTSFSAEGKNISIKFNEFLNQGETYRITFSDLSDFRGLSLKDITFKTSIFPVLNVKDNEEYGEGTILSWEDIPGVSVKINDGEFEKGHVFDKPGEYTLKITAEKNGDKEEREIKITISEAFVPIAQNVKIKGDAYTGALLEGTYEFFDQNGDNQGKSKFRWFRSSSENGTYEEIKDETDIRYTLKKEDENMYIKFAVIPVSDSSVKQEGKEYMSESFTGAFKPEIKSITVKGNIIVGEKLIAEHEFYDKNNDSDAGSITTWYISDKKDGEYKKIEGITGNELIILEEYGDKYVKVSVLPKADKEPYDGEEKYSDVISMPKKPEVTQVKIEGIQSIGNTLSVNYTYFDANGDEEGEKEFIWEDSNGTVLGKDATLKLISSMAGKSIRVGVKVNSVNFPYESDIAYSDYITIVKKSGGSGGSGGGGGMAMTGSNSGSLKPETPVTPPAVTPEKPKDIFSDISSHWAKAEIEKIEKSGIVNGFPDGTFKPDSKTTFIQFLVMALRGGGFVETEYSGDIEGISADSWFAGYLKTAIDKGFFEGYSIEELNGEIKREDAAVLVDRILVLEENEKELDFKDLGEISENKADAIRNIYNAGIMNGYTDGTFKPANGLTRAEAVVIISRVIGSKEAADEN